MARPKIEMNEDQVYKLAKYGCTNTEIADFFGCSESTVRGRFCEILTKARSEQKIRLRQLQWAQVENGNYKMMIWLGKQMLGQREKTDVTTGDEKLTTVNVMVRSSKTEANLDAIIGTITGENGNTSSADG